MASSCYTLFVFYLPDLSRLYPFLKGLSHSLDFCARITFPSVEGWFQPFWILDIVGSELNFFRVYNGIHSGIVFTSHTTQFIRARELFKIEDLASIVLIDFSPYRIKTRFVTWDICIPSLRITVNVFAWFAFTVSSYFRWVHPILKLI